MIHSVNEQNEIISLVWHLLAERGGGHNEWWFLCRLLATLLRTRTAYLLQRVTKHIVTTRQTTKTATAATDTAMIITVVVPGDEFRFPFAAESSPIASLLSSCGDETVLPAYIKIELDFKLHQFQGTDAFFKLYSHWHMIGEYLLSNILSTIWHVSPEKPSKHTQTKAAVPLMFWQVALFWHGSDEHGLRSESRQESATTTWLIIFIVC